MLSSSDFEPSPYKQHSSNLEDRRTLTHKGLSNLQKEVKEGPFSFLAPHIPIIYTIAKRFSVTYRDPALYDEMIQELYLRVEAIDRNFRGDKEDEKAVRKYFMTYMGFEARKIWRKYRKAQEGLGTEIAEDLKITKEDAIEILVREESLGGTDALISEAFEELTSFERWVLSQKFVHGLTYDQIQQVWNSSPTTTVRYYSRFVFRNAGAVGIRKLGDFLKKNGYAI